jgi:hypothetical protein
MVLSRISEFLGSAGGEVAVSSTLEQNAKITGFSINEGK